MIYFLDTPKLLCRIRIVRRFIERKIHRNSRRNETLKSVIALLTWTEKFYRVNLPAIKEKLEGYPNKVVTLKSRENIAALLS